MHTNFLQWHTPDSESRFDRVALTVSSRLRRLEGEFDGVTEIGLGVTNVNFLKGTNADRPRAAAGQIPGGAPPPDRGATRAAASS